MDRQLWRRGVSLSTPSPTHPPRNHQQGGPRTDELLREEKRKRSHRKRTWDEAEEEWEERDDRGNLWARGREMKRKRERRGARCSPQSCIGQLLSPECSAHKHTHRASLWWRLLYAEAKSVAHFPLNAVVSLWHMRPKLGLECIRDNNNKHTPVTRNKKLKSRKKQHYKHDFPLENTHSSPQTSTNPSRSPLHFQINSVPIKHVETISGVLRSRVKECLPPQSDKKKKSSGAAEREKN